MSLSPRLLSIGILGASAAALLTYHSCSVDRAETRGAVRQDDKWQTAQTQATNTASAVKRTTEAAGRASSLRVGDTHEAQIQALGRDVAVLRDRLRRAQADRDSAARRADLPCGIGAASEAAHPACRAVADLQSRNSDLQRANDALAEALIDIAAEGDKYRIDDIAWQKWWAGQQEALEIGKQAAPVNTPPASH